ncbi:hypothetical protein RI129_011214 [Pyrocoelia pectoralis]|uniref:tRNA-specific adenosine deaminase 1 n=1 Tax=Pyrocoelia pectoralis TaxID=417401 RepID=A0AAN7ZIK6_9COLE
MSQQNFHNQIASLSIEQFNCLPKTGKPNVNNEWTVLCCIIKEHTVKNNFEVVSLGTGSKCIGKSKMSANGCILNDSHAEIICRRAFLCYLYEQIMLRNTDLFSFHLENVLCRLNGLVKFHFFTTHVPCGDAAIFSKQNSVEFGNVIPELSDYQQKAKKLKLDDIYRTGAKCVPSGNMQDPLLEGANYHVLGAVRTKPGRGDPTLSVSCSDKLAKWCHVGVQGALLSLLLTQPIYFSSFTIAHGTPFNMESLQRALYGRFGEEQKRMEIGQSSVDFLFSKNEIKKPCPASIIWFKSGTGSHEVAIDGLKHGVTKKNRNTISARLQISKIEMFRKFLKTVESLNFSLYKI